MPRYLNVNLDGLILCESLGDGYSIKISWSTAFSNVKNNKILYNIYIGTGPSPDFTSEFFNYSPSFISIDGSTSATIIDLTPGQMYWFAVRAAEYDPLTFDPSVLPVVYNNLRAYPQSLLASNISATSTTIPLIDASAFPISGTVKLGGELIRYTSISGNSLLVPGGTGGTGTSITGHGSGSGNTGNGTISNLSIVGEGPTELWTVLCIGIQTDGYAVFEAVGSMSKKIFDGYGNYQLWLANGVVLNNGIISFAINKGVVPFVIGDKFTINVVGPTLGLMNGRGYNGTTANAHNTDGYDGYVYWDPNAILWPVEDEEQNTRVFECWNRFDINHFPYTVQDGYRQTIKDILTTDLTVSDAANANFPAYDFSGYHRTDPVLLLSGVCVGSYIGGQVGCVDGYSGVGMQLRGLNVQDVNQQRQEVQLSLTGEPVVLVRRRWTGTTCECMLPYNEYPEARCPKCLGTGIIVGWTQFFDPRRSDGRIMVRFDPTIDDLVPTDSGLEPQMSPTCWTLGTFTLKDRDFLVRFDQDGNEEFRYEVLNVTRNKLLFGLTGVQKFAAQRIRKTDALYQVPIFRDSSTMPRVIVTSTASSTGFPPHSHTIVVSEKITSISQINEITSVSQGHSHMIEGGIMIDPPPGQTIGHKHTFSL
jgi:hypothetical protein